MLIDEIFKDAQLKMEKSLVSLQSELSKLRTGRAHPSLLQHIQVDYYGSTTPLSQVATVSVESARCLTVTPWEKQMVSLIEKAIQNAGLGLNPSSAGLVIRIPIPPLTEERRKEFVKLVRHEAEQARIAIRNIRREAISDFKDLLKEKEITEDEELHAQTRAQKLTDQYVGKIDLILQKKEADLMEI